MSCIKRSAVIMIWSGLQFAFGSSVIDEARAVGVLYADPGWLHAFDGDSDYYHDPDGPHPDYVNGGDTNQPGGQGGEPALIDVGTACEPNCENVAIWQNRGTEWDGSAPGDPLGGVPGSPPPLPPAAPGGVGAFTDVGAGTTFLRIQDPGLPGATTWGWADKGAQADPSSARQEGNNRRIEVMHEMSRDAGFSGTKGVLDDGVTLSFRARIATAATGPIDGIYDEDGPPVIPWPTDGVGYRIRNNARGMVWISQGEVGGAVDPGRLAFSLLNMNSITAEGLTITETGLVMNNRALDATTPGSPDTNEATSETLNIVEIDDAELSDWHEFWITVEGLPAPVDGSTHEVNVYYDGALVPETFQVILGNQNEAGSGSFLHMGLSSGSSIGAFDVDFIAYKEGVIVPTLASVGLTGDYNNNGTVDAADYVQWRNNVGTSNPLENDPIGGTIGPAHYDQWKANFGKTATAGSSTPNASIPEPANVALVVAGSLAWFLQRNCRAPRATSQRVR